MVSVKQESQIFAIFDVDKTILPGYSIIDFAHFLMEKGLFKIEQWHTMEVIIDTYKKDHDYNKFADQLVKTYARGIAGQKKEGVVQLSSEFWINRLTTIFPFIHPLMRELAELDARKIAISGSPIESIFPLLQFLRFDTAYATQVLESKGKYTNTVAINAASQFQKERIVAEIMATIPTGALTYGYGDSIADLAFLSLVTKPTVVGTHDKVLNAIAIKKGWKIETSHES